MTTPYFSIITVCLNAQDNIEKTISSVLSQTFVNYEIIIKDGLSIDDTVKLIPQNDKIRLVEQKDSGIYDAMNQAISHVKGEYILFLNCGDLLSDNFVLENIYKIAISLNNSNNIIYGDYSRNNVLYKPANLITPFYLFRTSLCHQTMFINTNLFKTNGIHNLSYKILADYDFTLKSYFNHTEFIYSSLLICDYLGNGFSESLSTVRLRQFEYKTITKNYYSITQQIMYNIIYFLL